MEVEAEVEEVGVGEGESGAGLEDEGEGEVVGGEAAVAHGGEERNGVGEGVVGDEAADDGVEEEDVGVGGLGENDGGVLRGAEVEGRAEEEVEEVGVLVEAQAEEAAVDMLHFLQRLQA